MSEVFPLGPVLLDMKAMTTNQLTFGLMSGVEKVRPIEVGNVIVTHAGARCVVTVESDNIHGLVFVCVNQKTGAQCVVLEREIAYRSVSS